MWNKLLQKRNANSTPKGNKRNYKKVPSDKYDSSFPTAGDMSVRDITIAGTSTVAATPAIRKTVLSSDTHSTTTHTTESANSHPSPEYYYNYSASSSAGVEVASDALSSTTSISRILAMVQSKSSSILESVVTAVNGGKKVIQGDTISEVTNDCDSVPPASDSLYEPQTRDHEHYVTEEKTQQDVTVARNTPRRLSSPFPLKSTKNIQQNLNKRREHNRKLYSEDQPMITNHISDVRLRFRISSYLLGRGHFGVVRKCKDRITQEKYAIKSICKSKLKRIQTVQREISMLQQVGQHPHIVHLQEVHEDARYLHLIMDICTGGDLFDAIVSQRDASTGQGQFTEPDAAYIVYSLLDAISYCHEVHNVVHRDLKPENILLCHPEQDPNSAPIIKLCDFGLARHPPPTGVMTTKVGTPNYVAPEVLRGRYTQTCDVWSIGVIAYILLCGYCPFSGDCDVMTLRAVREGKFSFPIEDWGGISDEAQNFVLCLLEYDSCLRLTALEAMNHYWLQKRHDRTTWCPRSSKGSSFGSSFQLPETLLFLTKLRGACCATDMVEY